LPDRKNVPTTDVWPTALSLI